MNSSYEAASPAIHAVAPRGDVRQPDGATDTERWWLDAAYFPGGRADVGYLPGTEGEIAAIVRAHTPVLVVGAQSSLTGGATPFGGAVIATERLDDIEVDAVARTVRCGAGAVLSAVQAACREQGLFVAPVPTYDGAFAGGAASTNAAGAATFKYGAMRRAVLSLRVLLADGSVLACERGAVRAHPEGWFDVVGLDGTTTRVPVPTYTLPDVPKCAAGYFAAPGMDLVDLFVGSEGTLGVITEVTFTLEPLPLDSVVCWLPVADEPRGLEIAGLLRAAARATWASNDPAGLDVPSIEHVDRRCLELLVEEGHDRAQGIPIDVNDALVLIFCIELHAPLSSDEALDQLAEPEEHPGPLARLMDLLGDDAERLEIALPGEQRQAAAFHALREAVPMCANHRVRDVRQSDARVHKVGGDLIVPFEHFAEALAVYREEFSRRGLDHAIWGHVSDGNVHPNVLPRNHADCEAGEAALLAMGERVIALGGSPLAEHGVGRHPVKQRLLRSLYGDEGIAQMRAVKRALDPEGRLAPGVLFPWQAD